MSLRRMADFWRDPNVPDAVSTTLTNQPHDARNTNSGLDWCTVLSGAREKAIFVIRGKPGCSSNQPAVGGTLIA